MSIRSEQRSSLVRKVSLFPVLVGENLPVLTHKRRDQESLQKVCEIFMTYTSTAPALSLLAHGYRILL